MDYLFAKSEFEKLLNEINTLLKNDKIEYHQAEPLAQKTGVYIKNLFSDKEEDRKAYQKNFNHNDQINRLNPLHRMIDCRDLIEVMLVDINQNIRKDGDGEDIIHQDDEGKTLTLKQLIRAFDISERTNRGSQNTIQKYAEILGQANNRANDLDNKYHLQSKEVEKLQTKVFDLTSENRQLKENYSSTELELQQQLKGIESELTNAENKKTRLHREMKDLESQLKEERSQIGMYSESVSRMERERKEEINNKIKHRKDDLILLQSEVNGLKTDKARIEDQLKANIIDNDSANAKNKIAQLTSTNTTVINENESLTKENTELRNEVEATKNRPTVTNNGYYKPFITVLFLLLLILWIIAVPKYIFFPDSNKFRYGGSLILLILYGVLYFTTKEKFKDNIVAFIIGVGCAVLALIAI